MKTIESKKVEIVRTKIEVERERLKKFRAKDKRWWADRRSDWARRLFGDNLDEAVTKQPLGAQGEVCNICGKDMPLDEKFLKLEFSFCDEYGCGMGICKPCLDELVRLFSE